MKRKIFFVDMRRKFFLLDIRKKKFIYREGVKNHFHSYNKNKLKINIDISYEDENWEWDLLSVVISSFMYVYTNHVIQSIWTLPVAFLTLYQLLEDITI